MKYWSQHQELALDAFRLSVENLLEENCQVKLNGYPVRGQN